MDNILQTFSVYSSQNALFVPLMFLGAFLAGIIASLSPCSLGMLPLVIGYIGGYSRERNKKLFIQLLSFSIGLSSVLSVIGVICAVSGRAFTSFASPVVMLIFASVILIMGLNLIGFLDIRFPAIVKKMPQNNTGSLFVLPFLVGVFFALAASPCSSPILASILAIATISSSIIFSVALLFFFALGQCVIIIFAALFTSKLKNLGAFAAHSSILMRISGVLLILVSLYIYYAIFSSVL